jgi:ketosteroid isomerase-like protein
MSDATTESGAARQAMETKNRGFEQAVQAGDLMRAAQEVYTRNARVLPPGAPMIHGRDDIAGFWQSAAQQLGIRHVQLETVELAIHGEHAHEVGRATLTLASEQKVTGKYVVLWKREDGEWRWDVDIWNLDAQG